jgi:hypothetical protein
MGRCFGVGFDWIGACCFVIFGVAEWWRTHFGVLGLR